MDKIIRAIQDFYRNETKDFDLLKQYQSSSSAKARIRSFSYALQNAKTEQTIGACYEGIVGEYADLLFDPIAQSIVLASIVHCIEKAGAICVLDAGCGLGLEACFLAQHFPSTAFIATDISSRMIQATQLRIQRLHVMNVATHRVAHSALPCVIEEATCDFAYTFGSFHYITDADCLNTFMQFAHILMNGGTFVICGPVHADGDLYQRCAKMTGFVFVGPLKTIIIEKIP